MSISQEGREKAEEDSEGCVINYVFSNQLKAESLSGWQGFITSWNQWELQKIFLASILHKNHDHKEHPNHSIDQQQGGQNILMFLWLVHKGKAGEEI